MPAKTKQTDVPGGGKQSKEEERLLLESSRHVTRTATALFYGNGFIVSALPLWLYWRVMVLDLVSFAPLFAVVTLICTYLVSESYKKIKISLKHKISLRREGAVSKEVLGDISASGRKLSKAEKDERVSWKKNEVADTEATTFSIFYNNALFLFLVLFLLYFMRSFNPALNYTAATGGSGLLLLLLSSGSVN